MSINRVARFFSCANEKASVVLRQRISSMLPLGNTWRVVDVSRSKSETVKVHGVDLSENGEIYKKFFRQDPPGWLASSEVIGLARRVLLPVGYPQSVTPNYSEYVKYNTVQVACISVTRILATQSMLLAVGLSQGGALPLAAVMSWLLKDGFGQLGSILVGSNVNVKFDSNPKRYKFLSVTLGQVANLLGIASLANPHLFLLFTSLGGVFSRIATLALVSSRARIYNDFTRSGNLGDVVRCSQAQSTFGTLVGTAFGVFLAPIVGTSFVNIISVFLPLSGLTHWAAYRAVSLVELSTFNRHRFELVIKEYMDKGVVPDKAWVAERERFLLKEPKYLFPHVQVNPIISLENVSEEVVNALEKEGIHRSSEGIIFSTTGQNILREFFYACSPSEQNGWERFQEELVRQGWILDPTFIDCPFSRVVLEKRRF